MGNSPVSFIMSEKIQISFESAWDSSDLGDDSNKALRCHNPPKISVLDDSGAIAEDFASKLAASWRCARLRLSVNTPLASGVHPFTISQVPPKESDAMLDTQTRLLAGSVSRSLLIDARYSRNSSSPA